MRAFFDWPRLAAIAAMALGTLNGAAHATPGDLDYSFNAGSGKAITTLDNFANTTSGAVLQSDGKVVLVGACHDASFVNFVCLARYNADGSLDTTFQSVGTVKHFIGPAIENGGSAYAVAIQADGKIVLAGVCSVGGSGNFCLAKLTADGALDTDFSGLGWLAISVGDGNQAIAYAVAIQSDGQILAAGECLAANGQYKFCMRRFSVGGAADSSFGAAGGVVTTAIGIQAYAMRVVLQSDGKILLVGVCEVAVGSGKLCIARYTVNGALDLSFNVTGQVLSAFPADLYNGVRVAVQADGRILTGDTCCVTRWNSNGTLDNTFASNGRATVGFAPSGLALTTDQKILVAGSCAVNGVGEFCHRRYNADGTADRAYRVGTTIATPVDTGGSFPSAALIQADGKAVIAGSCASSAGDNFCLARFDGGPPATGACQLDLDGDGVALGVSDVLIGTRIALGFTGERVTQGVNFSASAMRRTWTLLRGYLVGQCGMYVAP